MSSVVGKLISSLYYYWLWDGVIIGIMPVKFYFLTFNLTRLYSLDSLTAYPLIYIVDYCFLGVLYNYCCFVFFKLYLKAGSPYLAMKMGVSVVLYYLKIDCCAANFVPISLHGVLPNCHTRFCFTGVTYMLRKNDGDSVLKCKEGLVYSNFF